MSDRISRRGAIAVAGLGVAAWTRGRLGGSALASAPRPLTLRQKASRLFIVSFGGTERPDAALQSLVRHYPVGGVILYGRNCVDASQIQRLIAHVRALSAFPLIVGVDQEGGVVERIHHGVHTFPSEAWYGANRNAQIVYADASTTARELHALGFTLNFAPVVDVISNARSPIGSRSYGSDPDLVSRLSAAAIRGYQDHGLAATAKHFIGLGHTSIDSHRALPTVGATLTQLESSDLKPFRAAVTAHVRGLLVAHVALPHVDPSGVPASLSRPVIQGLIRGRLKYAGAIVTDSLVMGALPVGRTDEAAEKALAAGADVLLVGVDRDLPAGVVETSVDRIVAAVQSGRIPERRLDDALARGSFLRPLH